MTPLAEESILFIFAQVAVLFAGFGGVSVVLGKLRTKVERARLRNVVITAFLLLIMSLFPLIPNQLGADPETTWRIGTGVLALVTIVFYSASGDLKIFMNANRVDQALMAGDIVILGFLIASTLGYVFGSAAAMYLIALFWHLLSACLMFIMVFAPIWQDEYKGSD